jgi:hypothetical protein
MRNVTSLILLLVILVTPAASQPPSVAERPLVIEGRVLWIDFGSETLMLAASTGPAIAIDLHRIGQSDYHGLRGNEYVRVVGYVLRPSRRLQAFQLFLVTPWFPMQPHSP